MNSKILIVEDELIEALEFKNFLISSGYDVVDIVYSGQDAINKVAEVKPDLILMDIILKGDIDGIEAASIIKEKFNIPIIYLTANHDKNIISQAKHTSPQGYLLKPVNKTVLKNTIELALHKHQLENKLKEKDKRYRDLVDYSIVPVYETKTNGEILFANNAMVNLFGYDNIEELETMNIHQFYKNPAEREKLVKKIKKNKIITQYEVELITKKGKPLNILVNANLTDNGIAGTLLDITERKKAEREVRENEQFLENIIENIPDMIFVKNANQLKFQRVNKATEKIWGYNRDELIGKTDYDFFTKEEADFYTKNDREVLNKKELHDIPKETIHTKYMGERTLHTKKIPLIDEKGSSKYLLGISEDITERKTAEKELKRSLQEKEVLLKEIHHRVKNNLQIISSLLNLQEDYVKGDTTAVNVLRESQNRVISMAIIHEMLYQSKDLNHINFSDYVHNMVFNLFNSYNVKETITPIINVDEIYLNIETSIPLGLIINELITNSLKYAFSPTNKNGEISISLKSYNNLYQLIISDNGLGLPEKIDIKNSQGLGLKLVNSLLKQLDGSINLDNSQGTKFTINFKELQYEKRI